MRKRWLLSLLLSLTFVTFTIAQDESRAGFGAGLIAGFNAAQLDGDNDKGYHRMGLHTGLKAIYRFPEKEHLSLSFEMLFSMRGSVERLNLSSSNNTQGKILLNYIDVPVLFGLREWNFDFHGGLVYSYLISSKANEFAVVFAEDFKRNDLSLTAGVSYFITPKWAATFRASRSVVNIVKKEINANALLGHWLTLRAEYYF